MKLHCQSLLALSIYLATGMAFGSDKDIPGAAIAPAALSSTNPAFKLSAGLYPVSGVGDSPGGSGLDVNLRYTYDGGNHVWFGYFRSPVLGFAQPRAGWDAVYGLGPIRLLPSIQLASGGFVGGSLAAEVGTTWFAGGGLGRTNLRDYANLNFDPNDSVTLYGGYRWDDADSLSIQVVRDNRQNPDQQNVHFVWRDERVNGERFTLDLLAKQGTVENRFIRRVGLSFNYEWPHWFAKVAWDPKVNFTPRNMVRLSTGVRF